MSDCLAVVRGAPDDSVDLLRPWPSLLADKALSGLLRSKEDGPLVALSPLLMADVRDTYRAPAQGFAWIALMQHRRHNVLDGNKALFILSYDRCNVTNMKLRKCFQASNDLQLHLPDRELRWKCAAVDAKARV